MKEFALIALILLLSACVQAPASQSGGELEGLGIDDQTPALEELPQKTEDTGLTGEPLDLGPLV